MLPLVALVGRPNVGKSTLFNALTQTRDALVADVPGLTRDRHYGICRLGPRPFVVVDTGGLGGDEEGLLGLSARQSQAAIDEAALVVFVVDARDGAVAQDQNVLAAIRRSGKPLLLAVNKTDGLDDAQALAEFAPLGVALTLPLAAAHRRGVGDLVDALEAMLPADPDAAEAVLDPDRIRLAIVGRPNVGKSTLVNRLLGEERVIASDVPGTTRDAISIDLERDGRRYRLIDTAGIRRKARVEHGIEKLSVIKALQAIAAAQVVLCLLDGSEGVTDQDASVLGHVLESGRALVVAVNKWDGLDTYQRDQIRRELERKLVFVSFAPMVFISAKHGSGLRELMRAVHNAFDSATRRFSTSEVTRALEMATTSHPPPSVRGRAAKLRFAHPGGSNPPTFIVHGTRVDSLPVSYKRYLENFFRERFKLVGTPLRFEFRENENPYEGKRNELTERQQRRRRRLIRHVRKS